MKPVLLAVIFLGLVLSSCNKVNKGSPEAITDTFDNLLAVFSSPSADYRPAPFWVRNKDFSGKDISRTLHDLKENGFGAVFLHPEYGMMTE